MKFWTHIFIVCVVASYHEGGARSSARNPSGKDSSDTREKHPIFRRDSGEDDDSLNEGNAYERLESVVNSESASQETKLRRLADDSNTKKILDETLKRFASEMAAADPSALTGNQHIKQDKKYNHLGRRFVPQYKYRKASSKDTEPDDTEPVPEKAPPELVLVVAKESALMEPDKSTDPDNDVNRKKILRSGDYWNGVWKEELDPAKVALRTGKKKVLGSIKAKIKPGSEFYNVVARMKKISPRLLYIINKKQL